jgi:hypothetical protein
MEVRAMKTRVGSLLLVATALVVLGGCFSAKAPEKIDVRLGSDRPEPVDSSRVPNPQTMDEARAELRKAYANIQYLEGEVEDLEHDKAKYKRKLDECEDRLERYEDD